MDVVAARGVHLGVLFAEGVANFLDLPDKVQLAAKIALASQAVIIVLQAITIILLLSRPPHA